VHINIYMLLKCACVLDFLKLAGMRAYPRVCGYPRIAGTGIISTRCGLRARARARILARGYGFMKLISARILPVAIAGHASGARQISSDFRAVSVSARLLLRQSPLFSESFAQREKKKRR